jgi:hypothetical protein
VIVHLKFNIPIVEFDDMLLSNNRGLVAFDFHY